MAKKKTRQIKQIKNDESRRNTFRKRLQGIIKKLIELSMLTGTKVLMKIYNNKEKKFLEYNSHSDDSLKFFSKLSLKSATVRQYAHLTNDDYDMI